MDKGTKVWQGSALEFRVGSPCSYYLTEGVISGVVVDGKPLVQLGTLLCAYDDPRKPWRETKIEAMRDAWRELVRQAGAVQAAADSLYAEIQHQTLTQEPVNVVA